MPAYITKEEVWGLSPGGSGPSDERNALMDEVIGALMERLDTWTGQFFASGYTGTHDIRESDYFWDHRDLCVAIPRIKTLTKLETYTSDGWEEVPADSYQTELMLRQKYGSGLDTIRLESGSPGRLRIDGEIGWGHGPENNPFGDDAVPARVKLEARKQARWENARLPAGGASGTEIYSGDLTIDMGGYSYLMSVFQTFRDLRDYRRLGT